MKVHHIGYLVKNMERAIESFLMLGYTIESPTVRDDIRKINICFMINEATRVELIESVDSDSAVSGLITKMGVTPYHICYEVPSIAQEKEKLKASKYIMTAEPEKAPALGDRQVSFFYNKNIGLIELVEER